MTTKGPHTLLEALLKLKQKEVAIHVMLAGGTFQANYAQLLRQFCITHHLNEHVDFTTAQSRSTGPFFPTQPRMCVPFLHPEALESWPLKPWRAV